MGMQQKLDKAYQEGFQDGQASKNETLGRMYRNEGFIIGSTETWKLVEDMIPKLQGIGPKTTAKILKAIQAQARIEKNKIAAQNMKR